jgi:hypothetical protein
MVIDSYVTPSSVNYDGNPTFIYACVGLMLVSGMRLGLMHVHYNLAECVGIRIKAACFSLLYAKVLCKKIYIMISFAFNFYPENIIDKL